MQELVLLHVLDETRALLVQHADRAGDVQLLGLRRNFVININTLILKL